MAEYLELPEGFTVDKASDTSLPEGFVLDAVQEPVPQDSLGDDVIDVLGEFAAGANRSVTEFVDFLGPDTANAILSLAGSDARVPRLSDNIPGIQGGFMDEGVARDMTRAAGGTASAATGLAGLTKQVAKTLPSTIQSGSGLVGGAKESGQIALRELARTGFGAEAALGAISGAGGEAGKAIGGNTGAMVGSIAAPLAASTATTGIKGLLNKGAEGIKKIMSSFDDMSEKEAVELLGQEFIREGITEKEVISKLEALGDEAIPADLGESFARLTRAAINQTPRLGAVEKAVLNPRNEGKASRISEALEDATGTPLLDANKEIARLNTELKPKIDEAYALAKAVGEERLTPSKVGELGSASGLKKKPPSRLEQMLEGVNKVGATHAKAQRELAAKEFAGEKITKIDIVDAHKRALDDKIGLALKNNEKNEVRMLTKTKKRFMNEVDKLVPEYKAARDLYAGKAELESAAKIGEDFQKLSSNEVEDIAGSMGESELKMFKLGAKKALFEKMDKMPISSDAVKRLFGRNGDSKKLESLFKNKENFQKFNEAMLKEGAFSLTRRIAQGNSTTTQQQLDTLNLNKAIDDGRALLSPSSWPMKFAEIATGLLSKKGSQANQEAIEKAGDILLTVGMSPEKVLDMLIKGSAKDISSAIKKAEKRFRNKQSKIVAPTAQAATAYQTQQD